MKVKKSLDKKVIFKTCVDSSLNMCWQFSKHVLTVRRFTAFIPKSPSAKGCSSKVVLRPIDSAVFTHEAILLIPIFSLPHLLSFSFSFEFFLPVSILVSIFCFLLNARLSPRCTMCWPWPMFLLALQVGLVLADGKWNQPLFLLFSIKKLSSGLKCKHVIFPTNGAHGITIYFCFG